MVKLQRFEWIDIAKSFAIILVVLGHVWRGLNDANVMHAPFLFSTVDNAIYYFHTPLFFMVSGFLFLKTTDKTWKEMLTKQAKYIIWPYILWSVVNIGLRAIFMPDKGDLESIFDLHTILYEPFGVFCFLYALFIFQIVLKWAACRTKSLLSIVVLGGLLHIVSFFMGLADYHILHLASYFFIFFVVGFAFCKNGYC